MAAPAQHTAEPERLYRIGDVSRLTDTKPFVLRFWETEFPMLQPVKTPKGHRLYRQQDIDLILAIKRLLYQEGFTIPGARRHLADHCAAASASPNPVGTHPPSLAASAPPHPVGADPSAAADVSARSGTAFAQGPQLQPVLFSPEPREDSAPRAEKPPLSAHQAETLRAVREELRAILTLLETG